MILEFTEENTIFNLTLDVDFKKGDILYCGGAVEVLKSRNLRKQWYYKVLRFLTFGKYFQPRMHHRVKII